MNSIMFCNDIKDIYIKAYIFNNREKKDLIRGKIVKCVWFRLIAAFKLFFLFNTT